MLSKLSNGKEKGQLTTIIRQVLNEPSVECLTVNGTETPNWREEIKKLMKKQDDGRSLRPTDAWRIARYVFIGEYLYRRGFSTPLLKCVGPQEASYVMDELHNGVCGFHTGRRTLKARALRAGNFWPTMEEDARIFVQKCKTYQAHANVLHAPPNELHTLVSP